MTPSGQKDRKRGERPISVARGATRNGDAALSQVGALQRKRVLQAMVSVTCRDGLSAVTVSGVLELARVGRRSFYDMFGDREDCLLAVVDEAVSLAEDRVRAAVTTEHTWADRTRVGLLALLNFFDEQPQLACVCVVHALAGAPKVLARRERALSALEAIIDEGRNARQTAGEISPLTAEGVLGAVVSVVYTRMRRSEPQRFSDLLNPLMAIVVLPYLGTRGSKRELSRERPRPVRPAARSRFADPLEGIEIRMTYRTSCVLAAIASAPGASNREVADAAGIKDQGQISKLLARLEGLELLHNSGAGQAEGSSNAWTLTAKGSRLARALSVDGGLAMVGAGLS
jgi:AcrR family transcriptional regulator